MVYRTLERGNEKTYVDAMPASSGYFLPEYSPMMFYTPTEHEAITDIKYSRVQVDYEPGFNEFAAALRGEIPKMYHGQFSYNDESQLIMIPEPEITLMKVKSTQTPEHIREELLEAHKKAITQGKKENMALLVNELRELDIEQEETLILRRRLRIKARKHNQIILK